jgi:ABC-type microcin C transport system duplicated ATPase subunit YejF
MIRTQIQLTEDQSQALKEKAAQENVSMAELIRRAVDLWLQTQDSVSLEVRRQRALAAVGQFHSGKSDVSKRHDEYLAEAYQE